MKFDLRKRTQSTTRPNPTHPGQAQLSPGRPPATCPRNFRFSGVRPRDSWALRAALMGGKSCVADLPNPAAARGTGRRPNGRGYQRRYGQIEDALRKKKTVGEVYQGFGASLAGRFGANLASRPPRTPGGGTLAPKTITKGEARGAGGAPTKRGMTSGAVYFSRALGAFRATSPKHSPVLSFFRRNSFA